MSEQGASFDSVAEDYLRARSEYPSEMFDRIFNTASLSNESNVLDVGCGSGQATLEFARRGSSVTAIDPAKSALDRLHSRTGEFDKIELIHTKFEDYKSTVKPDLIACGQSFHWLDFSSAPDKFADLLGPEGRIALFWHLQDIAPESPQANLYSLCSRYFKSFPVLNPPEYGAEFIAAMMNVLEKTHRFDELTVSEFSWLQSYDAEMFRALFRSSSNYAQLERQAQNQITKALDHYLDELAIDPQIHYRTCLIEGRVC